MSTTINQIPASNLRAVPVIHAVDLPRGESQEWEHQALINSIAGQVKPLIDFDPGLARVFARAEWDIRLNDGDFQNVRCVSAALRFNLTPEETHLIIMLARGLPAMTIAAVLHKRSSTVKLMRRALISKFGFTSIPDLVFFAIDQGLVPPSIIQPFKSWCILSRQQRCILETLRENPYISTVHLAAAVGIEPRSIGNHLTNIRRQLSVSPRIPKWLLPKLVPDDVIESETLS